MDIQKAKELIYNFECLVFTRAKTSSVFLSAYSKMWGDVLRASSVALVKAAMLQTATLKCECPPEPWGLVRTQAAGPHPQRIQFRRPAAGLKIHPSSTFPGEFPMKVWKQMLRTNASGQQPDPSSLKKRTHNQHQQMREPSLRLCKHGKWRVAAGGQGWEHLRGQPPEEVAFLHPEEKRLHTLPPAHSREGCGFVTQGLGRHHGKPKWETRHPKNSGEMKEAYLF